MLCQGQAGLLEPLGQDQAGLLVPLVCASSLQGVAKAVFPRVSRLGARQVRRRPRPQRQVLLVVLHVVVASEVGVRKLESLKPVCFPRLWQLPLV